eukprot:TRINITY_DN535_c0_g1_i1.p1 TRINITY_DN535_c0_g1~~TRINITY_DN535_c0_g1_i1.p1  ORF type:complete len:149 (-),score=23.86 TRINITY_DN535_c0_g1_i1:162-545(-)
MGDRVHIKMIIGLDKKQPLEVHDKFKRVAEEIAEKITTITGGLTWYFANGTWKLSAIPMDSTFPFEGPTEHDVSVVYDISSPSDFEGPIFNVLHNEVPAILKQNAMPINHIHVDKTHGGTAHHFLVK